MNQGRRQVGGHEPTLRRGTRISLREMRTHVRVAGGGADPRRPDRRLRAHHAGHRRDDHRAGTADHVALDETPSADGARAAGHPRYRTFRFPRLPQEHRRPDVPAPPNALTMTCSEFNKLDEATQLAVIRAILAQENNPLGPNGEIRRRRCWPTAACQFLPRPPSARC